LRRLGSSLFEPAKELDAGIIIRQNAEGRNGFRIESRTEPRSDARPSAPLPGGADPRLAGEVLLFGSMDFSAAKTGLGQVRGMAEEGAFS